MVVHLRDTGWFTTSCGANFCSTVIEEWTYVSFDCGKGSNNMIRCKVRERNFPPSDDAALIYSRVGQLVS